MKVSEECISKDFSYYAMKHSVTAFLENQFLVECSRNSDMESNACEQDCMALKSETILYNIIKIFLIFVLLCMLQCLSSLPDCEIFS